MLFLNNKNTNFKCLSAVIVQNTPYELLLPGSRSKRPKTEEPTGKTVSGERSVWGFKRQE